MNKQVRRKNRPYNNRLKNKPNNRREREDAKEVFLEEDDEVDLLYGFVTYGIDQEQKKHPKPVNEGIIGVEKVIYSGLAIKDRPCFIVSEEDFNFSRKREKVGNGLRLEVGHLDKQQYEEATVSEAKKEKTIKDAKKAISNLHSDINQALSSLNDFSNLIELVLDQNENLEKENSILKEKLNQLSNFNKNPKIAKVNKKNADKRALGLRETFEELISEGYKTNTALAEQLTKKKIKTPTGKSEWQDSTVRNMRLRLREKGFEV